MGRVSPSIVSLLLLAALPGAARAGSPSFPGAEDFGPSMAVLATGAANADDAQFGLQLRIPALSSPRLALFLLAAGRTWDKPVLSRLGHRLFIQRREQRYLLGLGLESGLPLAGGFGLYGGAGLGYSLADFNGTAQHPEEGWTPLGQAGLQLTVGGDFPRFVGRVGYLYADARSVDPHWASLSLGVGW